MTNALYTLTEEEKIRLADHEEVIDDGLNTFHKVGMALLDIRDNRLYRQNHATFEHYCEARWGMKRNYANKLIAAAEVVEGLGTFVPIPVNEGQARALKDFPKDLRPAIIKTADATAKTLNKPMTAGMIERVGEVIVQAASTGVADVNGEATPLTAALTQTEYEATRRERLHIEEAMARKNGLVPLMSSKSYEWYTPAHIARKAFDFLGGIELDPASSQAANAVIKARRFFNVEDNGLEQSWTATTVWMNPPYGRELPLWIEKLTGEYEAGHIMEALALVPARPDTEWFKRLRDYPRCFIDGRLKFGGGDTDNPATFPSMLVYLGKRERDFIALWSSLGDIYIRVTL